MRPPPTPSTTYHPLERTSTFNWNQRQHRRRIKRCRLPFYRETTTTATTTTRTTAKLKLTILPTSSAPYEIYLIRSTRAIYDKSTTQFSFYFFYFLFYLLLLSSFFSFLYFTVSESAPSFLFLFHRAHNAPTFYSISIYRWIIKMEGKKGKSRSKRAHSIQGYISRYNRTTYMCECSSHPCEKKEKEFQFQFLYFFARKSNNGAVSFAWSVINVGGMRLKKVGGGRIMEGGRLHVHVGATERKIALLEKIKIVYNDDECDTERKKKSSDRDIK